MITMAESHLPHYRRTIIHLKYASDDCGILSSPYTVPICSGLHFLGPYNKIPTILNGEPQEHRRNMIGMQGPR